MGSVVDLQPAVNGHTPPSAKDLKLTVKADAIDCQIQAPLPNPSLQVTADHQLKTQDAPVFAPRAGEVLLHIKTTGICG